MSELTDYIEQHGATVVAAQLRDSPDFRILNMMWKSPADLIPLADAMGWQTLADVSAWVTASLSVRNPEQFIKQALAPCSLTMQPYYYLPWTYLDSAIAEQCVRATDFWRSNSDKFYRVPTLAQLQTIAQECWSHRFQGGGEEFDCDDFVNIARGWLSSNRMGDLSAGKCIIRLFAGTELLAGHAVLMALSRESTISPMVCHWWEPQNGQTYPVSFTQFAGRTDCNRIELFFCDF